MFERVSSNSLYGIIALIVSGLLALERLLRFLFEKFKKGKIEIFVAGYPDIGFSKLGPTIGLQILFRALKCDVFISKVEVLIEKIDTGEKHTFSWLAFREIKADISKIDSPISLETASGFSVRLAKPEKRNILFVDNSTARQMKDEVLLPIDKYFRDLLLRKKTTLQDPTVIAEFNSSKISQDAFVKLNDIIYWKKGKYNLSIVVESERKMKFIKEFRFELTQADYDLLRLNIIVMTKLPDQGSYTYFFAYPTLIDMD